MEFLFDCDETRQFEDRDGKPLQLHDLARGKQLGVASTAHDLTEDVERPSARDQEMVVRGTEPVRGRTEFAPGSFTVGLVELGERTLQFREILIVASVHDVEIQGRDGGAVQYRTHASHDDELNVVLAERLQQREEVSDDRESHESSRAIERCS